MGIEIELAGAVRPVVLGPADIHAALIEDGESDWVECALLTLEGVVNASFIDGPIRSDNSNW
jgi:hypothetical protein